MLRMVAWGLVLTTAGCGQTRNTADDRAGDDASVTTTDTGAPTTDGTASSNSSSTTGGATTGGEGASGGSGGSAGALATGGADSGGAAGAPASGGTGGAPEGGSGGSTTGSVGREGLIDLGLRSNTMSDYEGLRVFAVFNQRGRADTRSEERSDLVEQGAFEVIWEQSYDTNSFGTYVFLYVDIDGDTTCSDLDPVWEILVNNTGKVPLIGNFDPSGPAPDPTSESDCETYEAGR